MQEGFALKGNARKQVENKWQYENPPTTVWVGKEQRTPGERLALSNTEERLTEINYFVNRRGCPKENEEEKGTNLFLLLLYVYLFIFTRTGKAGEEL